MSTKKTVDSEIVEDVEKIEPEVIEEVKEPVVDDVKEIVPVVKAPLRGISTPSMIHTHLDNFLAKLCGETPVDDKVRNSLEYWINELAKGNGGSTKKIYYHGINIFTLDNTNLTMNIFNNSEEQFSTLTSLNVWSQSISGAVTVPLNGIVTINDVTVRPILLSKSAQSVYRLYYATASGYSFLALTNGFVDLGTNIVDYVNAIN